MITEQTIFYAILCFSSIVFLTIIITMFIYFKLLDKLIKKFFTK